MLLHYVLLETASLMHIGGDCLFNTYFHLPGTLEVTLVTTIIHDASQNSRFISSWAEVLSNTVSIYNDIAFIF